jgi:hypothetical protein
MLKRNKKISKNYINNIKIGDILHYCPIDLKEESHDIGIIYDIKNSSSEYYGYKKDICLYKIFWQKSQMYDEYSSTTLNYKLNQICRGKNMMILINNHDNQQKSNL